MRFSFLLSLLLLASACLLSVQAKGGRGGAGRESPLGSSLSPNPSASAPASESHISEGLEHVLSQREQVIRAAQHVASREPAAAASRKWSPKQECEPKPIDFGEYNYCQANYPSAHTYAPPSGPGWKLASLQLLGRHGDRPPVNILPHTDVAYNLCDTTASMGFYENPGGKMAVQRDPNVSEGRRLEEIPVMGPTSLANPFARRLWQGNCMSGQLTSRGVAQLRKLGENLREIYVDKLGFLPQTYSRANTSVYVRSSDIWRTRQSAESLLSGLWPAQDLANAEVIPLHVYPAEVETLYNNNAACPELAKVQAAQWSSAAWKKHLDVPEVWQTLDEVLDVKEKTEWHNAFEAFYDNLQTRVCHNLPLPCKKNDKSKCIPMSMAEFIFKQGDWEYDYSFNESPLAKTRARLGISAYMSVVRDHMRAIVAGDATLSPIGAPQFSYHSAHDTSVAPVLGALGVKGFRWPPYASNILFELWQQTKGQAPRRLDDSRAPVGGDPASYYVRIIYNGVTIPMYAAGCCEEMCPYSMFIDYLDSMIPENLPDACHGEPMRMKGQ